jgi:hypothetical protein
VTPWFITRKYKQTGLEMDFGIMHNVNKKTSYIS